MDSLISLTDEQTELMTCLYEEAAEIIQVAAKIDRFGYDNYHPVTKITNDAALHAEVGDILAVIERLVRGGVLEQQRLNDAIMAKHARLDRFLVHQMSPTAKPEEEDSHIP
jgi:NTP pyrophosphatase (non-canonical NTP hydrolase)